MKDAHGKTIEEGQTLRRVVAGMAVNAGYTYKVVKYNFQSIGEGEDLVADGGFIKELLSPERVKEFEIIS